MKTDPKEETDAELEARRRAVEKEMYWARHEKNPSGDRRKALEQEWNQIRSEQTQRERKLHPERNVNEWTYKHDRRDEWQFKKEEWTKDGVKHTEVEAKGTVHSPESTINWRKDTTYGASREKQVRASISRDTGDDAGHLACAEWGADPEGVNQGGVRRQNRRVTADEERNNYGRQHSGVNQYGTYNQTERGITRAAAERGPNDPILVTVRERSNDARFGGVRGTHRTFEVKDSHGQDVAISLSPEEGHEKANLNKLRYASPSSPEMRAATSEPAPRAAGSPASVSSLSDHAHRAKSPGHGAAILEAQRRHDEAQAAKQERGNGSQTESRPEKEDVREKKATERASAKDSGRKQPERSHGEKNHDR